MIAAAERLFSCAVKEEQVADVDCLTADRVPYYLRLSCVIVWYVDSAM